MYMMQSCRIVLATCKHVDGVLASSRETDIERRATAFYRLRHAVGEDGAVAAVTVQLTDQLDVVRVRLERHLEASVGCRQQTVLVTDCTHSQHICQSALANNT